jgi:hypothetical protein
VNKDEEVFATIGNASLQSVGQIIGVCIATTLSAAKAGAKAVKVFLKRMWTHFHLFNSTQH